MPLLPYRAAYKGTMPDCSRCRYQRSEERKKVLFEDITGQYIQNFCLEKPPISMRQELRNTSKEDASPQEVKILLNRRQQYNQFIQAAMPQPLHPATMMKLMENPRQNQSHKMPERLKQLKGSASIVTSKQNADREPVMWRMESSDPERGNRPQMNPSVIER